MAIDIFASPEDICNRGLEIVGASPITSFSDGSRNANICGAAYDKYRLAELRRNVWTFACRRTKLWPLSTTSQVLTLPAFNAATTYAQGDLVLGTDGRMWVSRQDANTGNTPGADIAGPLFWDIYFGPKVAQFWNLPINPPNANATNTGYDAGEIVYDVTGAGTYVVYQSLVSLNTNDPDAVDAWSSSIMYPAGVVVSSGGTNYQSLVALNFNNPPATSATFWTTSITSPTVSLSWRSLSATLAPLLINWPLQSTPVENTSAPNAFLLPNGFMREAPQNPGAGRVSQYLGFPRNNLSTDWERDGNFLVSSTPFPIEYRFVANVIDVTSMDAMFCMGLGARIGGAVARTLSYEAAVVAEAKAEYMLAIKEARIANGIEQGPIMPPLDDLIAARL